MCQFLLAHNIDFLFSQGKKSIFSILFHTGGSHFYYPIIIPIGYIILVL